ncbi:MAG: DUF362 domain-containing protein [Candidatus Heimdallarchaeaceae archaeon]
MSKPKVAIVEIKLDEQELDGAVRRVVELAGGIPEASSTQQVLIKPNALTWKKDQREQKAITTDPRIVKTLAKILREKGYNVLIGDSSGSGTNNDLVLEKAGFKKLEKETDAKVISLTEAEKRKLTNGVKLKETFFSSTVLNSRIVNVPKMKTHTLTRVTLAIKNLFGCIPGMEKTHIHAIGNTAKGFSECLVDIYAELKDKIIINVMDAIIAMEGLGPSGGKRKEVGLVLASKDAVALDAVATAIMGTKPESVYTTRIARKRRLGEANLKNIEIVGERLENVKQKFSIPLNILAYFPTGPFVKIAMRQPKYKGDGCIACLRCQEICPKQAIIVKTEGKVGPVFDYSRCISCYSCLEMCPEQVIDSSRLKYLRTIIISLAILLSFGLVLGIVLPLFL